MTRWSGISAIQRASGSFSTNSGPGDGSSIRSIANPAAAIARTYHDSGRWYDPVHRTFPSGRFQGDSERNGSRYFQTTRPVLGVARTRSVSQADWTSVSKHGWQMEAT